MFATHNAAISKILRERRGVDSSALDDIEREHRATGKSMADLALEAGVVEREELWQQIAGEFAWEFVRELPVEIPSDALAALPGKLARDYGVMPLRTDEAAIDLVFSDPFDARAIDDLGFALGRQVRPLFGDPDEVWARVRQHYGRNGNNLDASGEEMALGNLPGETANGREIELLAEARPIIALVNRVIAQAIRAKASDIHFEPFEHEFKIRYRIDGILHEMTPPPKHLALPIASRVKVLANLDIAERRMAQDGRFRVEVSGRAVDLRVSTLPTQFGESVVLRILDSTAVQLDLGELGLPAEVRTGVEDVVRRPNGIFIVTGPTGCGKTTTLYSALRRINTLDLKLLTVEDPIEYEIEGIMQVAVNPAAGLSFASALRSFLRQDPDVVMVGEIRDLETAQIAIQAALTGHLVLSTLHTNDAPGAITRLIDMGVEPFLIASTVEAVLAQRLVRRVCEHCQITDLPDQASLDALELGEAPVRRQFVRGRGCPHCFESGYQGRCGIYEFMPMTAELRALVTERAPTQHLRTKAIEQGMRTLREDGMRMISEGRTTVREVLKFT